MEKFTKDFMLKVLDLKLNKPDYVDGHQVTLLKNEVVDTSRWSIHYDLVFKYDDKFYSTYYSTGATETQDEGPWEYEEPHVTEVIPVEKLTIDYVEKTLNE